jgi:hypothetical protein
MSIAQHLAGWNRVVANRAAGRPTVGIATAPSVTIPGLSHDSLEIDRMVVSVPSSAQSVSSAARAFSPTGCATCSIGLANSMELTRARVILGQRAALPGYGVERRRLQFQGAVLGVCSVFRDQFVVGAMQSRAGGSWRLTAEVVALQAQTRGRRRR